MCVEFGDHYDNLEVFYFALRTIESGRTEQGLAIIRELRNHIVQVDETKSREWVLPKIEWLERELGKDPGTRATPDPQRLRYVSNRSTRSNTQGRRRTVRLTDPYNPLVFYH